jgi:hypothetical protein
MQGDGNSRLGFFMGGIILIVLGLGCAIILNIILHAMAPSGGMDFFWFRVYPGWSWYATITAILGVLATLVGSGMAYFGVTDPSGPIALPDTETPH